MTVKIDKTPPEQIGSAKKDIETILDYLCYLRESLNFALEDMDKKVSEK